MSFVSLCKIIKRPSDTYYLQEKKTFKIEEETQILKDEVGNIIKKDPVGNIKEEWVDILELEGVVQHKQTETISEAGQESDIRYIGYFKPTFKLDINKLANYRVKFIRNDECLYLRITRYDPNNYLRGKQHHISLQMIEDRKYFGRQ